MPVEPTLNKTLKEMWIIDEKIDSGEVLTQNEKDFYNINLSTIKKYYKEYAAHWELRTNI